MTTILPISDLHIDHYKDGGYALLNRLAPADILVVAGDVSNYGNFEETLIDLCNRYNDVVYVNGNHCFYGATNFIDVELAMLDICSKLPNLTWLNNTRITVTGVSFIGATLWYQKTIAVCINKKQFTDYIFIPEYDRVFDEHDKTVKFFDNNMRKGDVVVAHHGMSHKSIPQQYTDSDFNDFFASHLDHLIIAKQPSLIIQGHTHTSLDYTIDQTRVICNPSGYPGENPAFNSGLIINV